jgi:hypothetical protein
MATPQQKKETKKTNICENQLSPPQHDMVLIERHENESILLVIHYNFEDFNNY